METMEDIVIVGAGLAGLATALGLHRKGVKSLVLESSPELRATGFAFTTWTNAYRAMDALGVGDKIRAHHVRHERLTVFTSGSGETTRSEVDLMMQRNRELEMRCVRRKFLLETMHEELPPDTIRYSSKIVSIEKEGNVKLLRLADGDIIRAKVIIGCDGVNSVVAKWLGLKKASYSGRSATRGLAEFHDGHGFGAVFTQVAGKGFRAGFIPCTTNTVYWFFTWSPKQGDGGGVEESLTSMRQYVISTLRQANVAEELIDVVERSEMGEVVASPLRYRSPLSLLRASIAKDGVCVAGDAFHPMTPDLGQGGCSALADSVVLARSLSEAILGASDGGGEREHDKRIRAGLEKYAELRRWRGIRLIATAYCIGFVQQSDGVFVSFLREKLLAGFMARTLVKMSDYDCGTL